MTINELKVHPLGKKLLVHTRNNIIYSVDSRFFSEKQKYRGILNREWPMKSDYSPDGRFVVSGSEDCKVYVLIIPLCTYLYIHIWEEETAVPILVIPADALGFVEPITCVSWNPQSTTIAVCSFGIDQPILVIELDIAIQKLKVNQTLPITSF